MLNNDELLLILADSKDATAVYDSAELRIRFVNEGMLAFWGKDNSIKGKTLSEAIPELRVQPFEQLLLKVWASGETYSATDTPATLLIDGNPKTSFFDFEYRPIKDVSGKTIAILHTAIDVTSRLLALKQVEEKQKREDELIAELTATNQSVKLANESLSGINNDLRASNESINRLNERLLESETDFKRLVAQSPVAIMVFRGPELVIELVNQPMLDILHRDDSVIGYPILMSMPELKGEPAVELIFEVYRSGKGFDGNEAPVKMMRNGETETRYFNFSYRPLMDGGRVVGVMDIAVEVTGQVLSRRRLEAIISEKTVLEHHLRANEQRLQGILDTIAEGVVIVNENGTPIYSNPMAWKIMGIDAATFTDRRYNDAKWKNERIDGSTLPAEDHPMHIALRTGMAVYDQEIAILMPGKEKIFISVNAAPLINEHERVSACIVTFTDVTSRRKILQEKDDFISVASHELKTPVTSLKASLQLLTRLIPAETPGMAAKLVDQANRSLNKLSDLINALLNSNRLSQGRFPVHRSHFKIAELINECCQHIRTAGTHQIVLNGDRQLEINADEQLIDQVLINFVNNAVKYAPQSKEIIIEVTASDVEIKISVTDFGPGIPREKLPHIFERYYRANHISQQVSGLGLGLFISAEIIRNHGGKIGAESEEGKGSTFWFALPRN